MNRTSRNTTTGLCLVGALGLGGAWHAVADQRTDGAGAVDENAAAAAAMRPVVEVWKSPTCGCCKGWVEYLEDEGFEVVAHDTDELDAIKAELGLVDPRLKSCHTAKIGDYVVEGHVPVSDIDRLLAERPDVVGISAPGMPMMSPGMGSREPKDYDVISFDADGESAVFASH